MTLPRRSNFTADAPAPDAWVEFWYHVWERAYEDHHPVVALYALMRGTLRALLVDLRIRRAV